MKRTYRLLYIFFVAIFTMSLISAFLIPNCYASNFGNNKNFIQTKFKTTYNKKKKVSNNADFTQVIVVSAIPTAGSSGNSVITKKNTRKHKTNIGTDKTKEIKTAYNKPAVNSPNLVKSGLLAKKGDFNNYQKNLSHIFPMIINKEIIHYIHYYQTSGRKFFKYALSRSNRYIPMIQRIFKKLGLPNDLAYLAMVESGFSPTAYSYAGASGMWQFIPSTGRIFGLTMNWWVDERRNPVESTYAAGEYLKDLFNKFSSWYLAVAAYNSGEVTIERALSLYPGGNFWTISQNRPYLLPVQTRRYVPKIIAAAIIAKDPENFGFHNIDYKKPIKFKQVNVPYSVSLYALAKCAGVSEYRLKKMNPELLRNATPPEDPGFMLNIPAKNYGIFIKNFRHVKKYIVKKPQIAYTSYSRPENNTVYTVEPGNTLIEIASKYGVPLKTIENYNGLNNYSILKVGEKITIPGKNNNNNRVLPSRNHNNNVGNISYIIVRNGMTLWSISRKYKVSLNVIKAINHIGGNNIRTGEKIFLKNHSSNVRYSYIGNKRGGTMNAGFLYYRVKFGDSLYTISSKFHDNVKNIMAANNINNPNSIYPGEILKIAK